MEITIKKARTLAGLSRAEMSRKFEIPIRTLENWESGVNHPPVWAEKLIIEKLIIMKKEGLDMVKNTSLNLDKLGCYKEEFLQKVAEIHALDFDEDITKDLEENEFNFFRMLIARDYDVEKRFHFEAKKKIVMAGKSSVFKNWKEHSTITVDDFLDALSWVCDDPKNGGARKCKVTREIALTPTGIKKLKIIYEDLGFNHLLEIDTGKKWEGEFFEQDCDKKFDPTGKVKLMQKICLSAECLI